MVNNFFDDSIESLESPKELICETQYHLLKDKRKARIDLKKNLRKNYNLMKTNTI
jgi:hypothetical protein